MVKTNRMSQVMHIRMVMTRCRAKKNWMSKISPKALREAIQPTKNDSVSYIGNVKAQKITVRKRKRPATKYFVQVLVYFEPPRKCSKKEQKDGKTEQGSGSKDAGRKPDLSGLRGNEAMSREATKKVGHLD
jgi:hypothetical protein